MHACVIATVLCMHSSQVSLLSFISKLRSEIMYRTSLRVGTYVQGIMLRALSPTMIDTMTSFADMLAGYGSSQHCLQGCSQSFLKGVLNYMAVQSAVENCC